MQSFELAGGTVAGRSHTDAGRNNQDAWRWICTPQATIMVVADGCSEGKYSEVGSHLGVDLTINSLWRHTQRFDRFLRESDHVIDSEQVISFPYWEAVRQDVLAQIRVMANVMGESFSEVIHDYFLFTLIGMLITEWGTFVFSVGDGVYALNGEVNQIGPFPNNEPPYLAYALVRSSLDVELLKLQIHMVPTEQVQSLLVGTDGVIDLIASAERKLPGRAELIGPLSQFWEDGRYFTNRDRVRRQLAAVNRTVRRPDWEKREVKKESGWLLDDTTLIVARRKSLEEG